MISRMGAAVAVTVALVTACTAPATPTQEPATQPPSTVAGTAPPGGAATPTATAHEQPSATATAGGSTVDSGQVPVGRIVFDSDRSGNLDIWYLEAGSSEPIQVTTDPGSDRVASWGPDGQSVIFASDRLGGPSVPSGGALRAYGLFIAYLDGSPDRHLLGTRTFNHWPTYSPDGSRIAFYSDATGTTQVYLLDPDYVANTGNDPIALTTEDHNDAPAWSPDGTRIVFSSLRDGNREIYLMDADGSNQLRLTDDPADDGSPAWSPDGRLIAFHSDRAGGRHIFVMDADGSNVRQLTFGEYRDGFPTWSPDGEWIAFDRVVDRDSAEILVMRADGSGLINVTNNPARDAFPAWGP